LCRQIRAAETGAAKKSKRQDLHQGMLGKARSASVDPWRLANPQWRGGRPGANRQPLEIVVPRPRAHGEAFDWRVFIY
jgi:hypothetical protein